MTPCSALLAAVSVLVAVAAAAPVPKEGERAVWYFPTATGARWVYTIAGEDYTEVVTGVEEKDGAKCVTVCEVGKDGRSCPGEVVAVSGAGLHRVAYVGAAFDAPACLLKVPSNAGDEWEYRAVGGGLKQDLTGTATFRGVERVEVPAGAFTAARVEYAYTCAGFHERWTAWYAPGVGLVREDCGKEAWRVLKAFTPGKG